MLLWLSTVIRGLSWVLISSGSWKPPAGAGAGCGQDRVGPLSRRASSYEVTSSMLVRAGDGRRIVRRPAGVRQPNLGSGRPRGLRVSRVLVADGGRPRGRRIA